MGRQTTVCILVLRGLMVTHLCPNFASVELQHAFFPPGYFNASPSTPPKPGDKRVFTALKFFIELRDGVALQIPFREASKVRLSWMEPYTTVIHTDIWAELAMGWKKGCTE